jgi:hypothetical protein
MSKIQLEREMRSELESLNRAIDRKIMLGLSYAQEARDHRALLVRIQKLRRVSRASLFDRFTFASGLF